MKLNLSLSQNGLDLIKHFEGLRLKAYRCSAGILTIGYGHTGADVKVGAVISKEKAEELLRADVAQFERDVMSLLKVPVTQSQFDALVSFAFNVGSDIDKDTIAEGLGDSTLMKMVNIREWEKASQEFLKWDKARDPKTKKLVALAGLTKRRRAEHLLFLGGDWRLAK